MFRILLTDPLDEPTEARLRAAAEIVRPPQTDAATLADLVRDADAIIARTNTAIPRPVLAAGRRLRVVGVAGVGVDHVDFGAAADLGIPVVHTPAASSDAVADFALALMLNLLRALDPLRAAYRCGEFHAARAGAHGRELNTLTVGILGLGRIGSRVARRGAGFGARVIYNDILDVGPFDFPIESVSKDQLWAESDILTLHVPLTPATRRLIDERVLAKLRPTTLLINTARGGVVDTPALADALRNSRLAGAALDVTDPEPLPPDHPLFTLDNCVLTPHVAARTPGGLARMWAVADLVLAILNGAPPPVDALAIAPT